MKVKVKKLYNGCVSVRDYTVNKAVKKKESLTIECKGATMIIPNEMILVRGAKGSQPFTSKFDGRSYYLVDFKWQTQ
jgi:hypothetical protein